MTKRIILSLSCLVALGLAAAAVIAQQPAAYPVPLLAPDQPGIVGTTYTTQTQQSQPTQLAQKYVKAEKEEEKKELRKKLMEMLNKQFDQHVEQQQKEVEHLEKQIADLKAVLKKRVESKTAIVDRRFEQLLQDAQGLGWTAPSGNRNQNAPFGTPPSAATKTPRGR
jgi:hypothetical protein